MSNRVLSHVLEHSKSKGAARLVLIVLADAASSETGIAWPSVATITQRANLSDRRTRDAIAALERLGELYVEAQAGKQNRYAFFGPDPIPADFICREAGRKMKTRSRIKEALTAPEPLHTPSGVPLHTPSGVPLHTPSGVPLHTPSGVPLHTPSGHPCTRRQGIPY